MSGPQNIRLEWHFSGIFWDRWNQKWRLFFTEMKGAKFPTTCWRLKYSWILTILFSKFHIRYLLCDLFCIFLKREHCVGFRIYFLTVIIRKTINDKIDNIDCTITYLAACMIMDFCSSYADFYFTVKTFVGQMFTRPNFQNRSFLTVTTQKKYSYLLYPKLYSVLVFSVPFFFTLVDCIESKRWTKGSLKDIIFYNFIIILKNGILLHSSNQ